jgi:hypothetical protein
MRPIVLAAPVRTGRGWAGVGQYVLPLPGLPAPSLVKTTLNLGERVAVAA